MAASKECPRYVGRVIRDVDAAAKTPDWLRDRLLTSGLKSISLIVDVTNYVMLELGQPMHAFDLDAIDKEIRVRMAKSGERITLLDGTTHSLDKDTLVIADQKMPLAIAGVMGGVGSSVTLSTQNIFLESAYFSSTSVARQRQTYGLNSDSAYRFERGIDPTIQREAIERATQLILQSAGGEAGPVIDLTNKRYLPKTPRIILDEEKVTAVLGTLVPRRDVEGIFKLLGIQAKRRQTGWALIPPTYRPDMTLPEDIIEEIGRLYGFDKIPTNTLYANLQSFRQDQHVGDSRAIRQTMADLGYHEIISYSFIEPGHQALFDPSLTPQVLLNPITAEMAVMRTSLWPGLVNAMLYNLNRQQTRIRLFEQGTCFMTTGKQVQQIPRIAGLITGDCDPEQWGEKSREVDFFDLKGDLCNLLGQFKAGNDWIFKPAEHDALHPGQTAAIYHRQQKCGLIGALHPEILQKLGIPNKQTFVFEVALEALARPTLTHHQELSKFPENRRDIAILINEAVPAIEIQDTIRNVAGTWLKDVFIFDVYQGKGITPGHKSVALALIVQHPTRTLVDEEINMLMSRVVAALTEQLGAELRS